MVTFKIAWRDIIRQRARSWLTIAAISFCTAVLLITMAFARGGHQQMIQSGVSMFPGHFQLQLIGYQQDPALAKCFSVPEKFLAEMDADERVRGAVPRIVSQGLVNSADKDQTAGAMMIGTRPGPERKTTKLAGNVQQGVFLEEGKEGFAIVGKTMGENLGVAPGEEIRIFTQTLYGSMEMDGYTVKGYVYSGDPEMDRSLVLLPLKDTQRLLRMESEDLINHVAVVLESPRFLEEVFEKARGLVFELNAPRYAQIAKQNAEILESPFNRSSYTKARYIMHRPDLKVLVKWQELMPDLVEFVFLDNAGAVLYVAILVIVVAFVILLTVLMSVLERTREFGVMMAIGTRPNRLFRMIMIEAFLLALVGIVAGLLLGSIPAYYFNSHPIDISAYAEMARQFGMEPSISTIVLPVMYPATAGIILFITILVSFFPARRAGKVEPVEALRHV